MRNITILCFLMVPFAAVFSQQLSVKITSPTNGSEVVGTLTVTGTSTGAISVELAVDSGTFQTANGVEQWNVILEPGAIPDGTHSLIARAEDASGAAAFDTISVTVTDLTTGGQNITYASSVDGETMGALLWMPQNLDLQSGTVPLFIYLHGGGGTGVSLQSHGGGALTRELDKRGWIGLAPDGRAWGLNSQGCSWRTSAAYVDNPDPAVGPGERDILDAIEWAKANFPIDEDRIYLSGFSMGGRGTYMIGLRNPDIFAAIAPMSPAADMYEIFVRRPNPPDCKEGMVGGKPGDSDFVNTMYTITSGRFLIENAYNLPVFQAHGLNDAVANNIPSSGTYLHGFHMLMDTSWDQCHGTSGLCFGHTPTLSELQARHTEGYDWAYMFTQIEHKVDSRWVEGTPVGGDAQGVEDSQNPGNLISLFEFLSRHTRVRSPNTIVYKTYTDTHRKAYWAEIAITTPWQNIPGAIRATRDSSTNALSAELVRVDSVFFDLDLAGLSLDASEPLTISMDVLNEPVFDPALQQDGETVEPTVVLRGDFTPISDITVTRDGATLSQSLVALTANSIAIGPLSVSGFTTLSVSAGTATSVDDDGKTLPVAYRLGQSYPNPFNPSTTIEYQLPAAQRVVLTIYNMRGQTVRVLVDAVQAEGLHRATWDGKDQAGHSVPSGIYMYQLTADNSPAITKQMLLIK